MRKAMLACGLAAVGLLTVGCDSNTPAPNKGGTSGPNPAAAGAAKAREMEKGAGGGMTAPTGR
jgi:hypothetical protein